MTLVWALRHGIMQLNLEEMSRERLWNSTSSILDMIYNNTADDNMIDFLSKCFTCRSTISDCHCRTNRRLRLSPFPPCLFIDSGYQQASALAMDDNHLYVADRSKQKIYVLTLLPNGFVLKKELLPLNTSTVADIESMFIHDHNLIWLTTSGHIRTVSLITYQVRNLFWFDKQLRAIRLVSFAQWPNRTTTTTTRSTTQLTTTTTTTTKRTTTKSTTDRTSTSKTSTLSTSSNAQINTTKVDYNESPWKATTFVTSIILGIALFLCAAMITCVLLNYRLGRVVPNSFTNIFHILRNRTTATSSATVASALFEESFT